MTAPAALPDVSLHLRTLPAKAAEGDHGRRLRNEFARVVAHVGHKQAAAELGTQESTLSHMLAGRGQRYLRLEWVWWALSNDPTDGFARVLLEPSGLMAVPIPELTDRDLVLGIMHVASQYFGQKAMESFMADAHGAALQEAAKRRGG